MGVDEPVKQFNVYLPVSLIRELKLRAVETESSLSHLTTLAVREFLDRPHQEDRP